MNTFRMKHAALAPIALVFALGLSGCGAGEAESEQPAAEAGHAEGEDEHAEGEAGHAEEEAGGERVTIPVESARESGIVVATAGPGAIEETLNLTGRIMLQPSARAEVHAPYSGPVRAVLRNVGDSVRRNETLARVESAESLQTYAIVTPIAGVVLDRQTNIGDVTSDQPLFVVGDLSRLQAELNVATRDIGRISSGQRVFITGLDGTTRVEAQIASVLPTADAHSQTLIARAPLSVSQGSALRPGMAVRGTVVTAAQQAAVAVPRDAVQTLEGRSVVFVRVSDDTYEARPVTLGRTGATQVEILSGLAAGEAYVSENAFLVKAEIGKGSASHDH
ncbi:efflux RND transporter periplasmic adaptor subunit [Vitreimonas sp.]|uniref:efflux RND transporter periplasmic adaptor subunit n=1 Tax=Vitreimonas sp. TaxID=3069702 RepID=UPI002EDA6DDC